MLFVHFLHFLLLSSILKLLPQFCVMSLQVFQPLLLRLRLLNIQLLQIYVVSSQLSI